MEIVAPQPNAPETCKGVQIAATAAARLLLQAEGSQSVNASGFKFFAALGGEGEEGSGNTTQRQQQLETSSGASFERAPGEATSYRILEQQSREQQEDSSIQIDQLLEMLGELLKQQQLGVGEEPEFPPWHESAGSAATSNVLHTSQSSDVSSAKLEAAAAPMWLVDVCGSTDTTGDKSEDGAIAIAPGAAETGFADSSRKINKEKRAQQERKLQGNVSCQRMDRVTSADEEAETAVIRLHNQQQKGTCRIPVRGEARQQCRRGAATHAPRETEVPAHSEHSGDATDGVRMSRYQSLCSIGSIGKSNANTWKKEKMTSDQGCSQSRSFEGTGTVATAQPEQQCLAYSQVQPRESAKQEDTDGSVCKMSKSLEALMGELDLQALKNILLRKDESCTATLDRNSSSNSEVSAATGKRDESFYKASQTTPLGTASASVQEQKSVCHTSLSSKLKSDFFISSPESQKEPLCFEDETGGVRVAALLAASIAASATHSAVAAASDASRLVCENGTARNTDIHQQQSLADSVDYLWNDNSGTGSNTSTESAASAKSYQRRSNQQTSTSIASDVPQQQERKLGRLHNGTSLKGFEKELQGGRADAAITAGEVEAEDRRVMCRTWLGSPKSRNNEPPEIPAYNTSNSNAETWNKNAAHASEPVARAHCSSSGEDSEDKHIEGAPNDLALVEKKAVERRRAAEVVGAAEDEMNSVSGDSALTVCSSKRKRKREPCELAVAAARLEQQGRLFTPPFYLASPVSNNGGINRPSNSSMRDARCRGQLRGEGAMADLRQAFSSERGADRLQLKGHQEHHPAVCSVKSELPDEGDEDEFPEEPLTQQQLSLLRHIYSVLSQAEEFFSFKSALYQLHIKRHLKSCVSSLAAANSCSCGCSTTCNGKTSNIKSSSRETCVNGGGRVNGVAQGWNGTGEAAGGGSSSSQGRAIRMFTAMPPVPINTVEQRALLSVRKHLQTGAGNDNLVLCQSDGATQLFMEELDELLTSLVNKLLLIIVVKFQTCFIHAPARAQLREFLVSFVFPGDLSSQLRFRDHVQAIVHARIRHFRDSVGRTLRHQPFTPCAIAVQTAPSRRAASRPVAAGASATASAAYVDIVMMDEEQEEEDGQEARDEKKCRKADVEYTAVANSGSVKGGATCWTAEKRAAAISGVSSSTSLSRGTFVRERTRAQQVKCADLPQQKSGGYDSGIRSSTASAKVCFNGSSSGSEDNAAEVSEKMALLASGKMSTTFQTAVVTSTPVTKKDAAEGTNSVKCGRGRGSGVACHTRKRSPCFPVESAAAIGAASAGERSVKPLLDSACIGESSSARCTSSHTAQRQQHAYRVACSGSRKGAAAGGIASARQTNKLPLFTTTETFDTSSVTSTRRRKEGNSITNNNRRKMVTVRNEAFAEQEITLRPGRTSQRSQGVVPRLQYVEDENQRSLQQQQQQRSISSSSGDSTVSNDSSVRGSRAASASSVRTEKYLLETRGKRPIAQVSSACRKSAQRQLSRNNVSTAAYGSTTADCSRFMAAAFDRGKNGKYDYESVIAVAEEKHKESVAEALSNSGFNAVDEHARAAAVQSAECADATARKHGCVEEEHTEDCVVVNAQNVSSQVEGSLSLSSSGNSSVERTAAEVWEWLAAAATDEGERPENLKQTLEALLALWQAGATDGQVVQLLQAHGSNNNVGNAGSKPTSDREASSGCADAQTSLKEDDRAHGSTGVAVGSDSILGTTLRQRETSSGVCSKEVSLPSPSSAKGAPSEASTTLPLSEERTPLAERIASSTELHAQERVCGREEGGDSNGYISGQKSVPTYSTIAAAVGEQTALEKEGAFDMEPGERSTILAGAQLSENALAEFLLAYYENQSINGESTTTSF